MSQFDGQHLAVLVDQLKHNLVVLLLIQHPVRLQIVDIEVDLLIQMLL